MPILPVRPIDAIPELPFEDLIGGGLMHPRGVTLLYGSGGIGKGLVGSWVARQLAEENIATLLLDFENHEQEWVARLRGVRPGFVLYHNPAQAIDDIAPHIRGTIRDYGVGAIIIDSASRAQPELKRGQADSASVRLMYGILQEIACPTLVLAHVPKGKEDEPRHVANPIGSVHWTTQARMTWSAIPIDGPSGLTTVEVKVMKVNDRVKPATHIFQWDWEQGQMYLQTVPGRVSREWTLSRSIWNLLESTGKAMTAAEISVTLMADFPERKAQLSRIQVQRMLYKQVNRLYRKVQAGWVSIKEAPVFRESTYQVEGETPLSAQRIT